MKPFSTTRWRFGTTMVYLLEDRIEVGVLSSAFSEELRRMAYRDATSFAVCRVRRPGLRIAGVALLGIGAALAASVLLGLPSFTLIYTGVAALFGVLFVFLGREGTTLQFRVEGRHGSVQGVVGGSRKKQDRFVVQLLSRLEGRRRA